MSRLSSETIGRVRALVMGATGLVCLGYGVGALISGRPDPVNGFIPGIIGVLAAVVIFALFRMGAPKAGRGATDELYRLENRRALAIGYWVAVLLYPAFAVLLAFDWVAFPVAFAVMGTFTGAAYLIPFAVFTGRG